VTQEIIIILKFLFIYSFKFLFKFHLCHSKKAKLYKLFIPFHHVNWPFLGPIVSVDFLFHHYHIFQSHVPGYDESSFVTKNGSSTEIIYPFLTTKLPLRILRKQVEIFLIEAYNTIILLSSPLLFW